MAAAVALELFYIASGVAVDADEERRDGRAASHTDAVIAYMEDGGADAVLEVMTALGALLPATPAPHLFTPFVTIASQCTKRRAAVRAMLISVATASCAAVRGENDRPPPSLCWTLERMLELCRRDRLWSADGCARGCGEEEAMALRRACDVAASTTRTGDGVAITRTTALCRAVRRAVLCERVAPSGALAAMRAACSSSVYRLAAACLARGVAPEHRAPSASIDAAGVESRVDARSDGSADGSADVDVAAVCASFTHACVSLLGRLRHHASALDRRATRFRGPRFRDAARSLGDAVCAPSRGARAHSAGSTAPSRDERPKIDRLTSNDSGVNRSVNRSVDDLWRKQNKVDTLAPSDSLTPKLDRLTSGIDFGALELLGALSGGACEPAAAQPLTAAFALLLLARAQLVAPGAELAVLSEVLPAWSHFVCSSLPATSDCAGAAAGAAGGGADPAAAGGTAAGGADATAADAATAASHAAARHALLCWFALFCVEHATPAQLATAEVGDALRRAAARERGGGGATAAAPPSDARLLLELCARLATEAAS